MTRVVVVGAGQIGARHAIHAAAHPDVDLVAVIDPADVPVPAGVPRLASLDAFAGAAEAAIIAVPSDMHLAAAEAALARGMALLVEKPVTGSLAEARRLAELAGDRPVLAGYHRRHHPRVAALKALLKEGRIGPARGISVIWSVRKPEGYFDAPWRAGPGGSPVEINLVHELDLLAHVFGPIASVSGQLHPVAGAGRPDLGALVLRFATGMLGTVLFSDHAPSPWSFEAGTGENPHIAASGQDCWRIIGETGAIGFPSLTIYGGAADWGAAQVAEVMPVTDQTAPLDAQLTHLAQVVAGRAAPAATVADAVAVWERVEEINQMLDWEEQR